MHQWEQHQVRLIELADESARGEFISGVVPHTGQRRLPFGDRLVALPASALWS
ncbi:MAG: hypothetical protein ACRDTG_00680 [Pseudonocardiaceae bacterium]